MQVKELKNDGLNYELEVTVQAKELDKHIDAKLAEYAKTMRLPGFRPGKVPLAILKQRYGKAVMGEVLEKAVNDTTMQVLTDKKLRPAMQPKIEITSFDEGKDLTYKMEVEVMPEFEVKDLKGLKVEKLVAKVDKKEIDDALARVAKQRQESEPITEDRAAKEGDILLIDFKGRTKDGTEYPGMASEDHKLELGSNQFIGGFEEQLVGKKKGDKVEVNVTFPDPYQMAELAGVDAIFDVDVKDIHVAKPAKIDDEFAKGIGFEDEKALRGAVEEQIQSEYEQFSRMKLKRALLDQLDDAHEFDIPEGMRKLEYASIKQQVMMEKPDQVTDGKLALSADEEEELQAIAERRVRLGLILSEIGRANNIQITDQELQRAVITEAQKFPGQEAQVFEYYKNNRQALEALRAPVFEDKVVDFIIELTDVKEKDVSVEELTADDEESYLETRKSKGKGGAAKKTAAKKSAASKDEGAKAEGEKKTPAAKKPAAKKTAAEKAATKKKAASGE